MNIALTENEDFKFRYEVASLRFELALLKEVLKARNAKKSGFDPNQPRVPAGNSDGGQWANGGGEGSTSGNTAVHSILGLARQFAASGYSPSYLKCLDICSPLLERFQPSGSDRNKYDFHRCMRVCIGR